MTLMLVALLGLALGSFINALVWRLHEQEGQRAEGRGRSLSILGGRSMCVHCGHRLGWRDLLPVVSWITLGGKCRYCHRPISPQYPVVEIATAMLFIASYFLWPYGLDTEGLTRLIIWLPILTLLIALLVYDIRWNILPDRLTYIVLGLSTLQLMLDVLFFGGGIMAVRDGLLGLMSLGGLFYVLFQVSKGKWIGGGDVKLGFGLGILAGSLPNALLLLFLSAALGSLVSVVLIATHRASRTAQVPYGPFLVVAAIIVQLFGAGIIEWYQTQFLLI